jgi:hypothetical protein
MDTSDLQLTPEMRAALSANPGSALYIADKETRKFYLLVEQGAFPELEEEYVRARIDEGLAAADRGDEEEWDSAAIKAEGRRVLQQKRPQ